MKINYRIPEQTADISARKGSDLNEFVRLTLWTIAASIVVYWLLGVVVDYGVSKISPEKEQQLFSRFTFENGIADHPQQQHLEALLQQLQATGLTADIPYRVVILENATPNAFAFPGGTIGITAGLLELIEGKTELAFVLGHELGHFAHHDHLRGIGRSVGLAMLGAVISGTNNFDVSAITTLPTLIMSSTYSRTQETGADEFAMDLLQSAYGSTEGFDALFKRLEEQSTSPQWMKMLSTHPLPEQRILHLRAYADDN